MIPTPPSRQLPWLLLLLTCWAGVVTAGEDRVLDIPLAKLMTSDRPLRLEQARGSHTLSVPLSARSQLRSATLELNLVNSVSLLKHRSQLRISLNDRIVAQLPLDPAAPEATARVNIPAGYFKPGYNRLGFSAAQHYTERCEDATAPELWTEIDTLKSRLSLRLRPRDLSDARLSELNDLFDEKLWGEHRVNILSQGALDDQRLAWGGLLAQGVALRFNYVPVHFRHQPAKASKQATAEGGNFPGLAQQALTESDNILVGTLEQLRPYLGEAVIERIDGAHLALYPLDADPRRLLVLVSGTTPEEVSRAARAFAYIDLPYPDTRWMRVDRIETAPAIPHATTSRVLPNGSYPLSRFGFQTRSLQGMGGDSVSLNIELPPDLYAPENTKVELDLHLAYSAGMREDSVLHLYLNGNFETSVPLSNPAGGSYRHYRVDLPLRTLQPGFNHLELKPRLIPRVTGDCTFVNTDNLVITLFEDSRLIMPDAAHFTTLPDLRLFHQTGFPHTVQSDGSDLHLHLASNDSAVAGAAWTLLGKLTQRAGMPLEQASLSLQPPPSGSAILIGALTDLDPTLLDGAPMRPGNNGLAAHPVAPGLQRWEGDIGWLDKLQRRILSVLRMEEPAPVQQRRTRIEHPGRLGRYSLAMQYQSPALGDHTATALLADDPQTLLQGVELLVDPRFWDRLDGDLTLWRDTRESIANASLGKPYTVGELTPWWQANFYLSHNPWAWGGLVAGLVLLMAWIGLLLLRSFRRRHRPDAVTNDGKN